jgi:tRNA U55 pseudouridine synthase TruB
MDLHSNIRLTALTETSDDRGEADKIVDRPTFHFITAHAQNFSGPIKQL